jgi:uncharacterized membrane protein
VPLDSIGTLLTRTLEFYKAHLGPLVLTAAIVLAPVYLVRDGLSTLVVGTGQVSTARLEQRAERMEELTERMQNLDPEQAENAEELRRMQEELVRESLGAMSEGASALGGVLAFVLGVLLTVPLTVVGTLLAQGAVTLLVNDRAGNGNLTPGGAWAALVPRLPALLGTGLLVAVGVLVGTLLCVLPGLVFGFACAFVMPVVVTEKMSGVGAIERSLRLVQVDLVRVLIALLLLVAVQIVFGFVASVLPFGAFGSALVADLLSIVILPLPIVALVLMHRELLAKGAVPAASQP